MRDRHDNLRPNFSYMKDVDDKTIKAKKREEIVSRIRDKNLSLLGTVEFGDENAKNLFAFSKNAVKITKGAEDYKRHLQIFIDMYLKGLDASFNLPEKDKNEIQSQMNAMMDLFANILINNKYTPNNTFLVMLLGYVQGMLELHYNYE